MNADQRGSEEIRARQIAELRLPLDRLPDPLPIPRIEGGRGERPFDVSIRPPGSKSITNRAVLLAALAEGTSTLSNALVDADDAEVMLAAIQRLGAGVERAGGGTTLRITGVGGRWKIPAGETVTLDLHNAGTATRFLSAAAILAPPGTSIIIDGDKRMRERPIGELAAALKQLGATVEHVGSHDCPPLRITPPADLRTAPRGVSFDNPKSSQFISAIMLIAAFLPRPTTIDIRGHLPSEPYIAMSQGLLGQLLARQRGPKFVGNIKGGIIRLSAPSFPLKGFDIEIEPDASSATYFAAAAMLTPRSRLVLAGLPSDEDAGGGACRAMSHSSMSSAPSAARSTRSRTAPWSARPRSASSPSSANGTSRLFPTQR